MSQTIEQLAEKRQRWIDANKENNFDEGIKRLLTELYPDNAHFIYELLQNAEDTGASVVRFTLSGNAIDFEHNGQRLFNLKDIDSITSIGVSTKRDDPTNIGKFGVGFKAVFAYTSTPEIHSGEFHFRIKDMVVPTVDGVEDLCLGTHETRFTFPFNHPTKKPVRAVEEIERGLRILGDNTLLFLNHIDTIEYLLPDGSLGYLRRIDHKNGHIEIIACPPGGDEAISHWLRYQKNVEIAEEDDAVKACQVAIAYSLQPEEQKKKNQPEWKIVPLDQGQVSIYFPAEKETSNLRFHIHAPFASTVARDSVRNCNENIQLLDSISQLQVESFDDILARRMLTMGFLAVLPNSADNLSLFYKPIFVAAVKAFQEKPLTPTRSGSHAPATGLYRGPAKIAEVIGDDGLALLTDDESPLWAANPPQQNQRDDRFLDSLKIGTWGWSELSGTLTLSWFGHRDKCELIEAWISQKSDAWVMRFYALFGEACDVHDECLGVCNLQIVRILSEEGHEHASSIQAFFPSEQNVIAPHGICFVKPAVYSRGRSETQKKYAFTFLQQIGVRSFNVRTAIELKLVQYSSLNLTQKDKKKYYSDIKQFVNYFKSSADIQLFKNKKFLLSETEDDSLCWYTPDQICIDAPFLYTGLCEFTSIHGKHVLGNGYMQNLKKPLWKDFRDFLMDTGVMHSLSVIKVGVFDNPDNDDLFKDWLKNRARWMSSTAINDDYTISGIEKYISIKSVSASRLIWLALIKADRKVAKACFCPNNQCITRKADSQLVCQLKSTIWIPGKDGVFRKPQHMTRDLLPDDFPYDDRNELLTAIDFGKDAEKRKEAQRLEQERQTSEYKHKEEAAKELGFESPEKAEELARLIKEDPDGFEKLIEEMRSRKQQPAFPERSVPNPERRQEKMAGQLTESPEKHYEKRSRSVRTTNNTIDPTTWLRNHYTNKDDQMVCQICKEEMPFRKRDGKHYFEKKEVLSNAFLKKEHESQYLALCPLCAAKYEEFVKKDGTAMITLQESIVNAASCEVPIVLGEETTSIRFVEAHLLDLQTIIDDVK